MKRTKEQLSTILSFILVSSLLVIVSPANPAKEARAAGYGLSNPRVASGGVTTWDCIYFGNYWQEDTNGDGIADKKDAKRPIKWRVLSVDGDDAFLLADKNLDCQRYNKTDADVTWETCTLRQWLNSDFYENAFDSGEQSAIRTTAVINEDNPRHGTEGGRNTNDNVYLLSISEAGNAAYGFNKIYSVASPTREAKNTEYTKACGAYNHYYGNYAGNSWWWLRSSGYNSGIATRVRYDGLVYDNDNYSDTYKNAVRPALHLKLSSFRWSKAGTVSSAGGSYNGRNTGYKRITPPAKVKLKKAVNKKGRKLSLSWNKVKEAKGYRLQYAGNKKFKKKKSRLTKKTKYTIKKLKKKKTYYIRVRAYKVNSSKKVYARWSKVKKIKVKR